MNREKDIKILAIETSCDETAAAVISEVKGEPVILSNVISSSVDLHAQTGGIVPEVASRAQMEFILPVITKALRESRQAVSGDDQKLRNSELGTCDYQQAYESLADISHIAVTAGPGLIGSLLVGFNAAKTLAYTKDLPLIAVNHIEGHIYSAMGGSELGGETITNSQLRTPSFPLIALTVSGGHTLLVLMKDHGDYEILGGTIDDAVGEAYDKVAQLLGLGYPGGPALSKLASEFRDKSEIRSPINFPRPIMRDGTYNFSFSGLKTAVLIYTKKIVAELNLSNPTEIDLATKQEIAAAFEEAVADVLSFKLGKAIEQFEPKTVVFAGGVSANKYLCERLQSKLAEISPNSELRTPSFNLTGDNAAMIGLTAYHHIKNGQVSDWRSAKVDANLKLI